MNIKNYKTSRMFCTNCGKEGFPIMRNRGKQRKSGHLKILYCINCKDEHNFVEIKDTYTQEDFEMEFELGRFVEGQRMAIADCLGCKNHDCKYNAEGKCWNYVKSLNCEERDRCI